MNIKRFYQQTVKLGYIFVLLCLLALNSVSILNAKAQGEITETPSETPIGSNNPNEQGSTDSCDIQRLADSESLFIQLTQAKKDNPGSVSQDDLQNAALQFTLESEKCYQVIATNQQNQDEPVYIDEDGLWVPGYIFPDYLLNGRKWGTSSPFDTGNPPGTAGGTVTFSFMNDGIDLSPENVSYGNNVAITSLPTYQACFLTEIRNAFSVWSAVARIQFAEVTDNGQPFNNASAIGDIRIGAHTFDGPSSVLAHAYYPPPNGTSGAGDLHFDRQENWTCDTSGIDIGIVALHEIGHSIGLGHEPTITAVMNAIYNPSLNVLQSDDINGAEAIYGTTSSSSSTTHCGTINSNQTWISGDNVHVISCNVTVSQGYTLTIGQGAIVKFQFGTALIVQGSLRVLGVGANQVYLTSIRDDTVGGDTNNDGASNCSPGDWSRIEFQDNSNDANSLIDYAVIRCGGWGATGGITLMSASPTIQNSTFASNAPYAIRANLASLPTDPASLPTITNNTYTNNGINGLALQGGTISNNATWNVTDTAYFIIDNVTVGLGNTLTVTPGVVVKFNYGRALFVQGALRVLGTSGSKVYFTSIRDDTVPVGKGDTNNDGATTGVSGDWSRIEFQDSSDDANTLIDYTEIRYGYYGVFYKLKSAQFIIEKVPTLKKPTLKLLSKRGPLYYRKVAHFCPAQRAGDKISIAQ